MPSNDPNSENFSANMTAFDAVRPDYELLGRIVQRVLEGAAGDLGIAPIIQMRVKERASFAEKSTRKQAKYSDPVNTMTDLCGLRAIADSIDDLAPLCEFIRRHFEIDEPNTEDTFGRLQVGEFGYRSVHFIVSLKPQEFSAEIAEIEREALARGDATAPEKIARFFARREIRNANDETIGSVPRYRMEIQVRSLLQHTWANLYHDRAYKGDFKLPPHLERDLRRIAAILEEVDANFARVIGEVDGFREYYGAYLSKERLEEERERLMQVLTLDGDNLKLALKAARMSVCLEDWAKVIATLEPFVEAWRARGTALDDAIAKEEQDGTASEQRRARLALEDLRDPRSANLLLDYGVALWRSDNPAQKVQARKYLRRAIGLDLRSADAPIALAETYDEEGEIPKALASYRVAYEANPLEPRAVRGYLQLTAEDTHSLDFVAPMRPTLRHAIQRCRERAALGIYLPWAYFDIGCFHLLLAEPYEGLEAYAKGVELCQSDTPIDASLARARRLCRALHRSGSTEWSLLERLLLIARVSRRYRQAEEARAAALEAEKPLAELAKSDQAPDAIEAAGPEAEKKAELIAKQTADLAAKQKAADDRLAAANASRAAIGPTVKDPHCPDLGNQVVIVAGGCDPGDQARLCSYEPLLRMGFRDFNGTLFCGGTRSGIGQMVGDLPDSTRGPILKVTCLPQALPHYHEKHPAYRYYPHPGDSFSPLGAVQVWADILAQGIVPSTVRVLGIGGGRLAGFEYRLALTMGAKVGVLKGSGRAADGILTDPEWMDHPNLIALPSDPQTVRLFVAGFAPGVLTEAQREEAARRDHARNVEKRQQERRLPVPPENEPWDNLRADIKASIVERVELIAEQLDAVGLRAVKREEVPPGIAPVTAFTDQPQIDLMAEIEHARWCVRKFLDGWRWSERKDDQAKTHHDLIAWNDLDEPTKDKDRDYARKIPGVLAEQGFAIVPVATASASAAAADPG